MGTNPLSQGLLSQTNVFAGRTYSFTEFSGGEAVGACGCHAVKR